jgi:hypothetical protein
VTGKIPHIKEFIPFCTLGWKPKLKQDRSALRWRGTPVVFLAWDSLYRRKGKIVLSLNSLKVQRAKMQQKHFVFGKSWLDFVEEENQTSAQESYSKISHCKRIGNWNEL